jgi:hypothetical protein
MTLPVRLSANLSVFETNFVATCFPRRQQAHLKMLCPLPFKGWKAND